MEKDKKIYRYTLRLNENMHKKLSERAALNNRTMHAEIIEILRDKLDNKPSNFTKIDEINESDVISIKLGDFLSAFNIKKIKKE